MSDSEDLPKPKHRMKKLIKVIDNCISYNDCRGCGHITYSNCQQMLMKDALYYLRQTLEKSEKKGEK